MSKQSDRYNLTTRLEKFGDRLMTACEQGEGIESRIDVVPQIGAICRIVMTLKALRVEDRRNAQPDDGTAGSMVRKYANEFAGAAAEPRRAISAEEAASDDEPCWTDPADE